MMQIEYLEKKCQEIRKEIAFFTSMKTETNYRVLRIEHLERLLEAYQKELAKANERDGKKDE